MISANAQSIGSPHFVTGKVIARSPDGVERVIKVGDKIFASDTIITAASSAIHIDFNNGETVEVFSNQNFSLADYLQQNGFEFAGEIEAEQVEEVIAANETLPEPLPDGDGELTIEDILNLPAPTAGQQSAGGGIEEPVILPFDIRQVTPETRPVDTGIGTQSDETIEQIGGDDGGAAPVNNAPTIEVTANNFTENSATAGDVVATYTTNDENPASLTVSWNGPVPSGPDGNPYYQLDTTNNRVLLTQAGADHVNAGRDLPPVNLTVTDDSNQTGQDSGDPDVTLVNDAPESSNDSITTAEDTPKVLGLDDFGNYSDEENSPLAAVKITGLPTDGSLQYQNGNGQWVNVTLNQEISAADITGGKLRFVPDPNENGNSYATLNFKVGDGTDFSESDYTLTVDVTPVNDAPTTNIASGSGDEDSTGINVELSGSDVDGTVASFVIKSLPANGTLKLADGTVLKVGDTVPATNGTAGVVFVPNENWNGSTDFNFAAKDNDGLEDPTPATATVTVNAVNDAPTTNNASGSGDEDSTGINVELSGSDVDGTVASFVIKSLPANGTLKLADGTVLKVGDSVPATNGTAGVVFVPNENWNGSTDFNFAAKDNDGLEDPTPATATVTVNAVNDAPTTNNASGSGDEDSTGINVELSGSDVDGTVASFVIKSLPANGTLKLADGTVLKVGDTVPASNGTAGVVFVPNENWNGSTDFNFAAKDNDGLEDPTPATATVTVNAVNDAPTTNNASGSGDEDSTGINVELSGSDVDGTVASFVIKSLPANGTLKLADGTVLKVGDTVPATNGTAGVVFVPNENWNGSTDFNFAAKDNDGLEDPTPATATVTVNAVNDAPTTNNASGSGDEDSTGINVEL
ncbi:tandem-95 repeat protein, partial [Endozoicomonadaceae bacterium StTr2]